MPCWYYEKKELKNSPSCKDGLDSSAEAKYRREGARFIIEAGTKLGLRYDTCATGVVYFHRFYMFHSFKEFPRYVTAACCLFLAGKVEETPKKCKDIIKISQAILTPEQFSVFGNDAREEVMTLERILLQTIKFDLQVEHPYALLLKFAKGIKGDKEKTQKLVQMAWTFINDSLCTTLSLQWEPEIIAVSLMYLGTRLNKFEVSDWQGKIPGTKQKWWECFVEDLSVELMEDICHQVLDLYSPANQAADARQSPPPPPPTQPPAQRTPNSQTSDKKRSLQSTPSDPVTPGGQSIKSLKGESGGQSKKNTPQKSSKVRQTPSSKPSQSQSIPSTVQAVPATTPSMTPSQSQPMTPGSAAQYPPSTDFSQYNNPYIASSMFSSSYLSQEGAQNIQSMMGAGPPNVPTTVPYGAYPQPPAQGQGAPPMAAGPPYGMPGPPQYPPGYPPGSFPPQAPAAPGAPPPGQPLPQYPPAAPQQYPGAGYQGYPPGYPSYPPAQPGYEQQAPPPQGFPGGYQGAPRGPPAPPGQPVPHQVNPTAITTVRISGR